MERMFEWDAAKADANWRKHGIRFEEAARVFEDPLAVSALERIAAGEQRWQTLGTVAGGRLPVGTGGPYRALGGWGGGHPHHQRSTR